MDVKECLLDHGEKIQCRLVKKVYGKKQPLATFSATSKLLCGFTDQAFNNFKGKVCVLLKSTRGNTLGGDRPNGNITILQL